MANQIHEKFGGKIVLLKESAIPGVKRPDMTWRGKEWEIKSISSAKAADSALRKAIKQIHGNPGGVIFDATETVDLQKLISVLDARAKRSKTFSADIIVMQNGKFAFAKRYKK